MAHDLNSTELFGYLWALSHTEPSAAALLRARAKAARKPRNRRRLNQAARQVEAVCRYFKVAIGGKKE